MRRAGTGAARRAGFRGIGGGALWTPAQIASPGVWYAGGTDIATSGGRVDAWGDQFAGNFDMTNTGSFRPSAGTEDGRTVPDGDGVDEYLEAAGSGVTSAVSTTASHVFAVIETDAIEAAAANPWQDDMVIGNRLGHWGLFLRDNAGTLQAGYYIWIGSALVVRATLPALGTRVLIESWHTTSELGIRVAANAAVTTTGGTITGFSGTLEMLWNGGTRYLDARILELVTIKANLVGNADRDRMRSYLVRRWGVTA